MANIGFQFDANTVRPAEPGGAVWAGMVPMKIVNSEVKPTSANDGSNMLIFHVQALDGEYKGQSNLIRLNLWNKNTKAVEIAHRTLSSICHCTGRMQITDSAQLHEAMFLGVWEKGTNTYTDQQTGQPKTVENCECKDYRMIDGRTIKEALAGQPASQPYAPGHPVINVGTAQAQPQFTPQPQQQQPPAAQPQQFAGAPGFNPAGYQPPLPGAAQPATGFPNAAAGGGAPAPNGAPQGFPQPQGFGTAGSPPSAPQGFPQPAPAGFGAPGGGGAPSGFPAPGGPPQAQQQPGGFPGQPGPWGQH